MKKMMLTAAMMTLCASQAFAKSAPADTKVNCHGTEPFWSATISSESLTFRDDVVMKNSTSVVKEVSSAIGMSADFMQIYSDDRGPLAVVTSKECNNGMSDEIFPQGVVLFTGSGVFYGCCGTGKSDL